MGSPVAMLTPWRIPPRNVPRFSPVKNSPWTPTDSVIGMFRSALQDQVRALNSSGSVGMSVSKTCSPMWPEKPTVVGSPPLPRWPTVQAARPSIKGQAEWSPWMSSSVAVKSVTMSDVERALHGHQRRVGELQETLAAELRPAIADVARRPIHRVHDRVRIQRRDHVPGLAHQEAEIVVLDFPVGVAQENAALVLGDERSRRSRTRPCRRWGRS